MWPYQSAGLAYLKTLAAGPAGLTPLLLPIDSGLDRFPRVVLTEAEIVAVGRGQFVRPAAGIPVSDDPGDRLILTAADGRVIAVATVRDGRVAPDKVLIDPPPATDPGEAAAGTPAETTAVGSGLV